MQCENVFSQIRLIFVLFIHYESVQHLAERFHGSWPIICNILTQSMTHYSSCHSCDASFVSKRKHVNVKLIV